MKVPLERVLCNGFPLALLRIEREAVPGKVGGKEKNLPKKEKKT
ncbi:MAG: hypothetical protein RR317_04020 [Bilophila sp.]